MRSRRVPAAPSVCRSPERTETTGSRRAPSRGRAVSAELRIVQDTGASTSISRTSHRSVHVIASRVFAPPVILPAGR